MSTGLAASGYKIHESFINTIANDKDKDGWADQLSDVGGVIENTITIPPGKSQTLQHTIIWAHKPN